MSIFSKRLSYSNELSKHQVCSWFHTNCVYVPIRAFELEREGSGCDTFLIAFPFLSREALHKSRVTALRWPSCCRHCVYYLLCMRRLRDPLSAYGLAQPIALRSRFVIFSSYFNVPNPSRPSVYLCSWHLHGANSQSSFSFPWYIHKRTQ